MNSLPDELYRHIYSFIKPTYHEYQRSAIWCHKCGELLKHGEWYISMGNSQTNTYISYTCSSCDHLNVHFNTRDWMTLIDYIDQYDTT